MDKIDNKYISNAIDELINLLGIKEDIPTGTLLKTLRAGKIKECVESMAHYLGLPIAVNISYSNKFESRSLATTDSSGRGVGGITAQVSIPGHLPFYGSSELQNFPISVQVGGNFQRHPETFMAIMSHELAHILLHSLRYKEKDNEFYTDLTAMILGFSNVVRIGRKVVETREKYNSTEIATTTYGYLSDELFDFALNKIDDILIENFDFKENVLKKTIAYRNQIFSYKKAFLKFRKFMEYLDNKRNKRIRKEDSLKIVCFHQPDYVDELIAVERTAEKRLEEINDFCVGLIHYTQQRLNLLRKFDEEMDTLISEVREKFDLLNNDVSILRKYVGFFYERKINRQATLCVKD